MHKNYLKAETYKLKAKKSFGQHFLKAPWVTGKMLAAAHVEEGDAVFEIGPGKGVLTKALLARGARVYAVEKDKSLRPFLEEKFADEIRRGRLTLRFADVLDLKESPLPLHYKMVANIPYYITGEIMRKFLTAQKKPSSMTLLVQHEVAKRIARDPKESVLSLSVKAYGKPSYVAKVTRGAFQPAPRVDSAILHIAEVSEKNFKNAREEKLFFKLVKAGFAHKRKFLARNLEAVLPKEEIEKFFKDNAMNEKTRAENVPLPLWLSCARRGRED